MSITCGNCKGQHESVADVKACYGVGQATAEHQPLASDKQTALIRKLLDEKAVLQEEIDKISTALPTMGKGDASKVISGLLARGKKPYEPKGFDATPDESGAIGNYGSVPSIPATVGGTPVVSPVTLVTEGMYRLDGKVYKVQVAVHGSGNLYAKVLEGQSFRYAPGAIRLLRPEHKMTLEQAREWGLLYGTCCVCGRTLTDETSIANGIGPVCAGKGWW